MCSLHVNRLLSFLKEATLLTRQIHHGIASTSTLIRVTHQLSSSFHNTNWIRFIWKKKIPLYICGEALMGFVKSEVGRFGLFRVGRAKSIIKRVLSLKKVVPIAFITIGGGHMALKNRFCRHNIWNLPFGSEAVIVNGTGFELHGCF